MKEIVQMFRSSPLERVKTHADICLKCVEALPAVLQAAPGERAGPLKEVKSLESQADKEKAKIRRKLTQRLFMPVPKTQVLELVHVQDKIANRAKDIAVLFTHRFDELPGPVIDILVEFVNVNLLVVKQARDAIHELDELVETGFRGVEAERVIAMVDDLDKLESQSDKKQWELFAQMKTLEESVSPIDAMFLYRVTTLAAEIGDRADRTGRLLEQMLAG